MQITAKTDTGLVRSENQDRVMFSKLDDDAAVAVVCDGMGGENAGGKASELAVKIIFDRLVANYRAEADENSIRNLLVTSINAANSVVYEKSLADESMVGMGTTCVCGIIKSNIACIASVGDSRAYIINKDAASQLTNDHTMVRMLVDKGEINESEAENHPQKHIITRAVGAEEKIYPDYFETEIRQDTVVLMCTDGLSGYCTKKILHELVWNKNIDEAADDLIAFATEQGGKDNITVALVSNMTIQE